MKNFKENKSLQYVLGIAILILLCSYSPVLIFLPLCFKEDIFRPSNTEVLVSACKKPIVRGAPGGEVVFVHERLLNKVYLLDLQTGEKKVPSDPLLLEKGIFLSPDLVWLEGSSTTPGGPGYRPHFILDLANGQRYELFDLNWLPRSEIGSFDAKNNFYFKSAEYVFIHHSKNVVIALSSDFRNNVNSRVILSQYALQSGADSGNGKVLEQFMKELGKNHEVIDYSLRYVEIPSPTGKYVVRDDGIYIAGTNTFIVDRNYTGEYSFGGPYHIGYFRSWYYDESGVVVQENYSFLFTFFTSSVYSIPKPILKLNLPTQ